MVDNPLFLTCGDLTDLRAKPPANMSSIDYESTFSTYIFFCKEIYIYIYIYIYREREIEREREIYREREKKEKNI